MSGIQEQHGGLIPAAELRQLLQAAIDASPEGSRPVARIERTPYAYHSSFPLEELTVHFDDETRLELISKNADPRALTAAARRAKLEFLDDPGREIELYRHVLGPQRLGTAQCFGSFADPVAGRYWL